MKQVTDRFSGIIADYQIAVWDSEPTAYRFKATIRFADNSVLLIKDYLFPKGRKYAYHWQDEDGEMIMRWDNAPHWRSVDTYPHHRHERTGVFSSKEVTLEDILDYIAEIMKAYPGESG